MSVIVILVVVVVCYGACTDWPRARLLLLCSWVAAVLTATLTTHTVTWRISEYLCRAAHLRLILDQCSIFAVISMTWQHVWPMLLRNTSTSRYKQLYCMFWDDCVLPQYNAC